MKTIATTKPKLFSTLGQICKAIPVHLVPRLARETGSSAKVTRLHAVEPCRALALCATGPRPELELCVRRFEFRHRALGRHSRGEGAEPQRLSHANRTRDPELARRLFWSTLEHLQTHSPGFGLRSQRRYGFRFKRLIHLVDSTTILLVANCLEWARHRRRKAAAKCHMQMDWGSLLPHFVVVASAGEGDDGSRTAELCAGVKVGEIVVFDKAYVIVAQLHALHARGIVWVIPGPTARSSA